MTTRHLVMGVLWITLWSVLLLLKARTAFNPVPNPYMTSDEFAELPLLR